MSKGTMRYDLTLAEGWAKQAVGIVAEYSTLVTIAGSLRRRRADVGDIDLVVLEDEANPWQRGQIANALGGALGYVQGKDGERIATFVHASRAPIDVYYATRATYGITLLVRTGSASHNIRLTRVGATRIPARKLSVAAGILDTDGVVVAGADERECFDALGIPWVDPREREAPELEFMVGGE